MLPHHAVNFTVICCPLTAQTVLRLLTFSLAALVSYYCALSHLSVSLLSVLFPELACVWQRFSLLSLPQSSASAEQSSPWHPCRLGAGGCRSRSCTLLPPAGFVSLKFILIFLENQALLTSLAPAWVVFDILECPRYSLKPSSHIFPHCRGPGIPTRLSPRRDQCDLPPPVLWKLPQKAFFMATGRASLFLLPLTGGQTPVGNSSRRKLPAFPPCLLGWLRRVWA